LSREVKVRHSEVPWRDIAGMRDKLIHEYFGVFRVVWVTIKSELPKLKDQILRMLREMDG
jgi:uncharacterized protein with HEPN domain